MVGYNKKSFPKEVENTDDALEKSRGQKIEEAHEKYEKLSRLVRIRI